VISGSLAPCCWPLWVLLASCVTDTAAEPPTGGEISSGPADADGSAAGSACQAAGPEVAEVYDFSGTTIDGVTALAERHDMGIPHLDDPGGAVWRHFGITAQSAYVVLDADGVVVAEGSLGDEELAAEVAELVG
jgi:hypothetical protein